MMETQITLLTREMLTDYRTFSGKCIESPEDYMIFRRQAIKELGFDSKVEPEPAKAETKKPKVPIENKKEKPVRQTKPVQTVPVVQQEPDEFKAPENKPSESPPSGNFFDIISKIDG